MIRFLQRMTEGITLRKTVLILIGAAVYSFGVHNIHQRTGITEGGILGLMLLAEHWLGISPAFITPVLDAACYIMAYRILGGRFIRISLISTLSVSAFYRIWEQFPYMLPDLSNHPAAAALLGGLAVGTGVGLIVRQGGSAGGDDALALTISGWLHWRLSRSYLFTDLTVLVLSLSYIPARRIIWSLVTVTVSSYVIDFVREFRLHRRTADEVS